MKELTPEEFIKKLNKVDQTNSDNIKACIKLEYLIPYLQKQYEVAIEVLEYAAGERYEIFGSAAVLYMNLIEDSGLRQYVSGGK